MGVNGIAEPTGVFLTIYLALDVVMSALIIFVAILALVRRRHQPLSNRNVGLLLMSMLTLVADVRLQQVPFDSYCVPFNLIALLCPHFYGGAAALLGSQLYLKDQFEKKKEIWLTQAITAELMVDIQKQRFRLANLYLLLYWLALVALSLVVVLPVALIAQCNFASPLIPIANLWMLLEYVVITVVLIRKLRNVRDAFGVKHDLTYSLCYNVVLILTEQFLILALPDVQARNANLFVVFFYAAQVIFILHAILRPTLLTFHCCRRVYERCTHTPFVPEGGHPSLEQILSSELGLSYFRVHLRQEFSEENLLCVKSIDAFKRRPTFKQMHDITDRFLRPGAPLCVNLDFETRDQVLSEVQKWGPSFPAAHYANIFEPVRAAIIMLLAGDSLPRFRLSRLYSRFLDREPLPLHLTSNNDLHDPGSGDCVSRPHTLTHSHTHKPGAHSQASHALASYQSVAISVAISAVRPGFERSMSMPVGVQLGQLAARPSLPALPALSVHVASPKAADVKIASPKRPLAASPLSASATMSASSTTLANTRKRTSSCYLSTPSPVAGTSTTRLATTSNIFGTHIFGQGDSAHASHSPVATTSVARAGDRSPSAGQGSESLGLRLHAVPDSDDTTNTNTDTDYADASQTQIGSQAKAKQMDTRQLARAHTASHSVSASASASVCATDSCTAPTTSSLS